MKTSPDRSSAPANPATPSSTKSSSGSALRVVFREIPPDAQKQISQNLRIGRQAAARKK